MANHLIIGLGGTGGQILAGLRKRIFAELGEKDVVGTTNMDYLYVDSSEEDLNNKSNWTYMGEALHLQPDQKVNIHGMNADVLNNPRQYPGIESFLPEKDRELLRGDQVQSIITAGIGGQRRRFGRMLLANNIQTGDAEASFAARLRSKILELTRSGDGIVQFHVCAGLAGGTGSGSIIDVIAQIRKITGAIGNSFPLYLYLYVPEELVDEASAKGGFYHANGYAALSELNALALNVYTPTDVSGDLDVYTNKVARLMKDCDAFTKAFLFTNYNESGRVLPKNGRLPEAVADFLFQKTIAPDLVEGTGNGKLKRLENSENEGCYPEKDEAGVNVHSRDFMTFGIKRIEYPETEIKEYVTYNYAVQAAKQMEFNLPVEGKGYDSCSDEEVGLGYSQQQKDPKTLEMLKLSDNYLTLQAAIRDIPGVTENWDSFGSYWDNISQFFAEEATLEKEKRNWPAIYLDFCETEFHKNFRGVGVKKFFETQRSECKGYASYLRRHIESLLFNDWLVADKNSGKSLLQVEKYVEKLIENCTGRIKDFDDKIANSRQYLDGNIVSELAYIESEWNNIGWLRDAITGASRKIFDRYKRNRSEFYIIQTEIESYHFAKVLLTEIIRQLGSMLLGVTSFKSTLNEVLKQVNEAAESKCKVESLKSARSFEIEVLDKKYNPALIREMTAGFTRDIEEQSKNAREIREELVNRLGGEERGFAQLSQNLGDVDALSKCFTQICNRNAINRMNNEGEKDPTMKMLHVNILEKIKLEYNTTDALENYVSGLVEQAKCFIQFDKDEMGKNVPGTSMGRMIQLCLPEYNDPTNFRNKFIEVFERQARAYCSFDRERDVTTNYRDSQIVIITAASAFPLRFVQNIKALQKQYKAKIMGRDSELSKVLLHTESNLNLPELFEASKEDKRALLLPYAILLHSLNVLQEKTDPETGAAFWALGIGSGFKRKWVRVGKNMEETARMLVLDAVMAKSVRDYVDAILAENYKLNSERAVLRETIEIKVCETILPLVKDNDQDPLFEEYRNVAEKLFEERLADR